MRMFDENLEKKILFLNIQLIINLKKNLLDIDKKAEVNSASEHRLMVPICEKMTKSSYLVAEEHRVKQNDAFCPFLSNKFPHTGGPLLALFFKTLKKHINKKTVQAEE